MARCDARSLPDASSPLSAVVGRMVNHPGSARRCPMVLVASTSRRTGSDSRSRSTARSMLRRRPWRLVGSTRRSPSKSRGATGPFGRGDAAPAIRRKGSSSSGTVCSSVSSTMSLTTAKSSSPARPQSTRVLL